MATNDNDLMRGLARADRLRLLSLCEPVHLVLSEVLYDSDARTRSVIFPVSSFVSLVTAVDGDQGVEVGMVGREGMLGAQLALGVRMAPTRAIVQGAGSAWRVGQAPFVRELARSDALRRTLHRYLYVLMVQLGTASACRQYHGLAPRLARWLLMSHDRAQADSFHVTHEFMALMLGVRRVGVTVAAGGLQARGLIRYHRGELTVLDRPALELQACSCYRADRLAYRRHMRR
ncbi:MAG: Crp/Fnr family transcriptional regulator [Rubrivivax sp.]|nr:Crp/Fnr family transcriptional regulator [Rubrivivax sp.]